MTEACGGPLSRFASDAASLKYLFPSTEPDLSSAAISQWKAWTGAECPVCGDFTGMLPLLRPPAPCAACLLDPPPFFAARSLFSYEGPAGNAVRAIKYEGRPPASTAIAQRLLTDGIHGRWWQLFPDAFRPLIVPVPIRPLKYLQRGFNLPALIGGRIARRTGWPFDASLLERVGSDRSQAKLHVDDRRKNVIGAFRVRRRSRAVPGDVLLVDDVYTTGATTTACARELKSAGAHHIVVVTVARTIRSEDIARHPTMEA